jgi:hypothetical protein
MSKHTTEPGGIDLDKLEAIADQLEGNFQYSASDKLREMIALARRATTAQQAATTAARELYEILRMVAEELDTTSFSQSLVREGNSEVWRYIGKGEDVARKVREAVTKFVAPSPNPSAAQHIEVVTDEKIVQIFNRVQSRWLSFGGPLNAILKFAREVLAQRAAPAPAAANAGEVEPVEGDLLPPVGSKVLIHLARQDAWVEHTVVGYYVWGALSHQVKDGEKDAHRVFVRVKDANGYLNARLLSGVRAAAVGAAGQEGGAK